MDFKISIDSAEFQSALNEFPKIARKELRLALFKSAKSVALQAKAVHKYRQKSGNLDRSIQSALSDEFEAEVFFDEGIATYGKFQNYGTKPHRIYPKNKAALSFVTGGVHTVVPKKYNTYWKIQNKINPSLRVSKKGYVDHPGIKPEYFIEKAAEVKTPNFIKNISDAVEKTITQAGF